MGFKFQITAMANGLQLGSIYANMALVIGHVAYTEISM